MKDFNFSSLLEFPGILIIIGVVLLIVAVIIGIATKKNSKKKQQYMASKPAEVAPVSQMESSNMTPILPTNQPVTDNVVEQPNIPVNNTEPVMETPIVNPLPQESENVTPPPVVEEVVTPDLSAIEQPTTTIAYGGISPADTVSANMGLNSVSQEEIPVVPNIIDEPVVEKKDEEIETL